MIALVLFKDAFCVIVVLLVWSITGAAILIPLEEGIVEVNVTTTGKLLDNDIFVAFASVENTIAGS